MCHGKEQVLYEGLLPIYYVSKALGIMPLKFQSSAAGCHNLVPSTPSVIYSFCCLILTTLHGISAPFYVLGSLFGRTFNLVGVYNLEQIFLNNNITTILKNDAKQTIVMKIFNPILIALMSLSSRITGLILVRTMLPPFLNKINAIDKFLSRIECKHRPSRSQFSSSIKIAVSLAFVGFPSIYIYLKTVYESKNIVFGSLVWSCLLVSSNITSLCSEVQFICFAYLLKARFCIVNTFLKSLNIDETTPKERKEISRSKDNLRRLFVKPVTYFEKRVDCQSRVGLAFYCHRQLCDLMSELNLIYRYQLLFSISSCLIKTLFNIYFTIFGYVVTSSIRQYPQDLEFMRTIMWSIFYFVRFLTITIIASSTAQKATKAKRYVSAINNRFLNKEIKEELLLFSNHLMSRKLEFSACGFFKLNLKLITSAISAGTTYLVILVQFHSQ